MGTSYNGSKIRSTAEGGTSLPYLHFLCLWWASGTLLVRTVNDPIQPATLPLQLWYQNTSILKVNSCCPGAKSQAEPHPRGSRQWRAEGSAQPLCKAANRAKSVSDTSRPPSSSSDPKDACVFSTSKDVLSCSFPFYPTLLKYLSIQQPFGCTVTVKWHQPSCDFLPFAHLSLFIFLTISMDGV